MVRQIQADTLVLLMACMMLFSTVARAAKPAVAPIGKPFDFTYASEDGSWEMPCDFDRSPKANDDWLVECKNDRGIHKEFYVHLVVKKIGPNKKEQVAYQVLYWVFDRSEKSTPSAFSGSSFMITLDSKANVDELLLTQNVEAGTTTLNTRYLLPFAATGR